ncbi:MAG TPA: LamG-like jellyroll fold domain-containing protein, partial [Verrucomicrobiae bacterium]|nr:LamG-like jellyroll fold domain-containing protein [Verrucomicrobiae bacterium]
GDGSKYYIKLEQNNNGTNSYLVGITQLAYLDSVFSYGTPSNTWAHLAFVASGTNVSLYANGAYQSSITTNNFPLPRGFIGTGSTGTRFLNVLHGALDDIQVYNRMLNPSEINSIYSAGSAGLVRAPQVTQFTETNGTFTVNFEGLTSKTFTIYSSTNLTNWSAVTTLSNPGGTNSYSEAIGTNNPEKFFRIGQP